MPFLKKFSLLVLIFSLPAFLAFESTLPKQARHPAQAPYHSATEQQMMRPTCINQEHVRLNNLQNFIKKYSDLKNLELPANYEVHGIRFENEHPELVYRFMQLTTPDQDIFGSKKDFNPQILKEKYAAKLDAKNCRKVLCAVQEIFGKQEGPIILLILTEYDLNLSHLVWVNADPFELNELNDILRTIEVVPNHLLPVGLNQKFIRFVRGYVRDGQSSGVIANSAMEYFDTWSEESPGVRRYSIYHEFAHNWSSLHANNIDVSPKWLEVAGWAAKDPNSDPNTLSLTEDWTRHDSTKPISIYAKTNPFEDFAESVSAYRYAPQKLKELSRGKYNYVKNIVYGGMEFTSDCTGSDQAYAKYLATFEKFESSVQNDWIDNATEFCFSKSIKLLKNPRLLTGFLSCINGKAMAQALKEYNGIDVGDGNPLILFNEIGTSRHRFKSIERQAAEKTRSLTISFLEPHMERLNRSIQNQKCDYAFNSEEYTKQAKNFSAESYDVYYALKDLTKGLCNYHLRNNLKQANSASIRNYLSNSR